jgi:hypothetical protein
VSEGYDAVSVLIVQVKISSKAPYNQYKRLADKGVKVVYGNPADPSTYPPGKFDVVYDNNGKDLDTCKPLIDLYKVPSCHTFLIQMA